MVKLQATDIQTREVLSWRGIHLLHFAGSSCSQKTRIFLNLKGIDWQSHHVDLTQQENYSEWFMGISPRGLVPVLVDDGAVIIESNDILEYLEVKFPEPPLIPDGRSAEVHKLLDAEDELHLDLRSLSMRYAFPGAQPRGDSALENYEKHGSGTVNGTPDPHKAVELAFYRDMQANDGISDEQVRTSAGRFRQAYDVFNQRLGAGEYLLGSTLSLVDIAWYIYSVRLVNAGYPLHNLHPLVGAWFDKLNSRAEFSGEVQDPPPLVEMRQAMQAQQADNGTSLVQVAGFTGGRDE